MRQSNLHTRAATAVVIAVVSTFVYASTASAGHYVSHKPFGTMTQQQQAAWLKRQISHDQGAIAWLTRHLDAGPPQHLGVSRQMMSSFMSRIVNGPKWKRDLHWYRSSERIATRHLRVIREQMAAAAAVSEFPPHHALWMCIAQYESGGDPTAGNGSHFGLLAMSYNWEGAIRGNAADYPQSVQEWAAENTWKKYNYSYSFLNNQWYEWDDADGCGTTG